MHKSYFKEIRTKCLSTGVLYEDPEFPAEPRSIYFSKSSRHVQWRRPSVYAMHFVVFACVNQSYQCDDFKMILLALDIISLTVLNYYSHY